LDRLFIQNRPPHRRRASLGLKWVKRGNWRGGEKTSQELGLWEELILGAGRPFDHLCGDAASDGAEGDVVSNKTEGLVTHHTAFADTIIFKRP